MHKNRAQEWMGIVMAFGAVIVMSWGLGLGGPGNVSFAADKKPQKKSTKSGGKGLDDVKTSDVEVKASEGDTATAIRGKLGHADGDEKGRDGTATDSEESEKETGNPVPKK